MSLDTMFLKGKTAIVAGGGRGIGEATSRLLAEAGAHVAVADLEPDRAKGVSEAIIKAGGKATPMVANLHDRKQVEELVRNASRSLGGIDVLVNNAGGVFSYAKYRRVAEWSDEDWDFIMTQNLRYVFLTTRAVLKVMVEQGRGGSIVNIASISGVFSAPMHAAYGAAKAGLILFTKSIAAEYGREGIRANAVSPGGIKSPVNASSPTNAHPEGESIFPLGHQGEPDDIARAVLFFASDLSRFVTGQMLLVDGGASVRYPLDRPGSPTRVPQDNQV